ncbi:hypothetical protein POJ06DRAFT_283653 [Lipomyces tetrasporus]|uniref:PWWP domain-containing protein n=1 Tax=Lipomyces tetrasporus TaxID=54092 RepID=A0AAD7QKN1_9ASCO|nr:uncharacterized protein POJ06DRAFT_283653 [Lipomyces tetrasporus]KAJ8097003.1 hypothetical protein POJ06DRAFT_283653 [Lipomyces tetrasporus]
MSDDATKVDTAVTEAQTVGDAPAADAPETIQQNAPAPAQSATDTSTLPDAPEGKKDDSATDSGKKAEEIAKEEESKPAEPAVEESVPRESTKEGPVEESKSEQPAEEKAITEEAAVEREGKEEAAAEPEPEEKAGKKKSRAKSISTPTKASYLPGAVVLAKLKGFPPWPAMILADAFLPPHILKLKPKASTGTPGSARIKRKGLSVEEEDASLPTSFPVRFFNDDNYMWASRSDLKPLSREQAQKYIDAVSSKPSKKDKSLVAAYKIVIDPPTLEEFAKGTSVHASEEEEEEDVEMEEAEEEQVPEKKSKKRKSSAKYDDEEVETSTPATKRKKKEPKANGFAKKANGDAKEKKTPKKTPASGKKKSAASLRESLEERTKQVLYVRHKLQKAFLTRDKPPAEEEMETMDKFFTKLENFQGLEISIIRNTKINKVLKGIHKLAEIPLEEKFKFKERSRKMLEIWNHMFEGISSPAPAEASPAPVAVPSTAEALAEASVEKPTEQPAEISVGPDGDE